MERPDGHPRSHLFTIQVWEEKLSATQTEWRGKVQLLSTGERRYFRKWEGLAPLLLTMLHEMATEPETKQLPSEK